MEKFIKYTLTFSLGALIGSFVTKKYIDRKQAQEAELEYDREYDYENEYEHDSTFVDEDSIEYDKCDGYSYPVIREVDENYVRILEELKYKAKEEEAASIEPSWSCERKPRDINRPYNISPDEFEEDYESDEYTYYADGYVTDSYGMPVSDEDVSNSIGSDFADHFGSYSDDQIWIRNDRLQMDFSVIKDLDNFMDVAPARVKRMVGLE